MRGEREKVTDAASGKQEKRREEPTLLAVRKGKGGRKGGTNAVGDKKEKEGREGRTDATSSGKKGKGRREEVTGSAGGKSGK